MTEATKITTPRETEILITREFAAPKHIVYRAWTTPELVRRWWSGRRGKMTVCEIDLRVGGEWRYVLAADGGEPVGFHGTYREIVPNERLVTTEIFELPGAPPTADADADAPLNIVTFREANGRTTVELLVQCPTQELRDIILNSGMEQGLNEQMELLEELAKSL